MRSIRSMKSTRLSIVLVVITLTVVIFGLYYMGLLKEHIGMKMFVLVALFFSIDLVLIWTASLVH